MTMRSAGSFAADLTDPPPLVDNFKQGLDVIGSRAESLNRFLQNYAHLAKLPAPNCTALSLKEVLAQLPALEPRLHINIASGPDVQIHADPDQLQQALINLVINAADSVLAKPEYQAPNMPLPADAVSISWGVLG